MSLKLDFEARRAVNLNVLQRHDKNICEIIDSASHVVVYEFSRQTNEWSKRGVEGTLFLFRRSLPPTFGFFVMNRLSVENFIGFIAETKELQITEKFIIYRTHPDYIFGIWMYEASDRTRIGNILLSFQRKTIDPTTEPEATPTRRTRDQELLLDQLLCTDSPITEHQSGCSSSFIPHDKRTVNIRPVRT